MVKSSNAEVFVANASKGLVSLIYSQLFARALTFGLKIATARVLGPADFAFVEIKLGVLISLSLLPAKEGIRRIAIRERDDKSAADLAALSLVCSAMLTIPALALLLVTEKYRIGLVLASCASLFESAAERFLVLLIRWQKYAAVGKVRATALVVESIMTALFAYLTPGIAVYGAATGKLLYGFTLWVGTRRFVLTSPGRPTFSASARNVTRGQIRLVAESSLQSVVKFVLGDGENFVLTSLCSETDAGAYKLVGNVASLLARFLFEPLEEQCFAVFSKLNSAAIDAKLDQGNRRAAAKVAASMASLSIKAVSTVALIFALVGPPFALPFFERIYGEKWAYNTPAVSLLSWYFGYLCFMAVNGVSEAYFNATASGPMLRAYGQYTLLVSAGYVGLSLFLTSLYGPVGVIVANTANMACRIIYCSLHMTEQFRVWLDNPSNWVANAIPGPVTLLALIAACLSSWWSRVHIFVPGKLGIELLVHLLVGFASCCSVLGAILVFDRQFVLELRKCFKSSVE